MAVEGKWGKNRLGLGSTYRNPQVCTMFSGKCFEEEENKEKTWNK